MVFHDIQNSWVSAIVLCLFCRYIWSISLFQLNSIHIQTNLKIYYYEKFYSCACPVARYGLVYDEPNWHILSGFVRL